MRANAEYRLLNPASGICALLSLSALLWLTPAQVRPVPSRAGAGLSKVVIGYYAGWTRAAFGHLQIKYSALTHITHACTWPDSEGNLVVPDDYLYPELVQTAHESGVKMILMIGGWGLCDGFPGMASRSSTRQRFVGQVVDFCRAQDYDGVDIDWEFPSNPEDKKNFSLLILELSSALRSMTPPRILTMAVSSGDYYGQWIDFEMLHPYLDYISFMTYDFHGPWSDHAGHNAPLYDCPPDPDGSMDQTFHYARQRQVPLEKLLLGVPFYGRSFDCAGLGQSFMASDEFTFAEAMEALFAGWAYYWDDCAKVPYLVNPNKDQILCFDDPFSVAHKCGYVLEKQAAGLIIWELSQDDFRGIPLLIRIIGLMFRQTS